MKVIVCGGRDYRNMERMLSILDAQHAVHPIAMLIEGGAHGADELAHYWAMNRCIDCLTVPANWSKNGRGAGPIRNARMLDYKPDLVIAFPGGRGTANMIKQAKAAGVRVIEIESQLTD
jgi:hypothetical protein